MTKPDYKIVLSDKLYSIYKKATTQHPLNTKEKKAYELLLESIEHKILTNAAQVKRCKDSFGLPVEVFEDLYPVLLTQEDQRDLTLRELSERTLFKLIITQANDENSPPFLNIKEKIIKRNYIIAHLHDESRKPLQDYLTCVFKDAKTILIHDQYFSCHTENAQLFDLLPNKNIEIQYIENAPTNGAKNSDFMRNCCKVNNLWRLQQCDTTMPDFNRFSRSHDRYILIDNTLEITLTSGFYYIWNSSKEITCVIRAVNA